MPRKTTPNPRPPQPPRLLRPAAWRVLSNRAPAIWAPAIWATAVLATVGVLPLAGCDCNSGGELCTEGAEGCACAEGRCLTGLVCLSNLCVDPLGPDAGSIDGGTDVTPGTDAGTTDGTAGDGGPSDAFGPNPDAFFEMDPPPVMCLEDGSMVPGAEPPGGTPECPDDKNREGCPCTTVGETASCWPGLRVHRNRGICMDGTTRCERGDEFSGRWGPCEGYVLPVEGVELGASACRCFSRGVWEIDNLSPCFITYNPGNRVFALSTDPSDGQCPDVPPTPPPVPAPTWSANRLTVDCEGRFELCYTIKAGNVEDPQATDCTVGRSCTGSVWYETRDTTQEMPALPSWVSTNETCSNQFMTTGGYGEMTVRGLSVDCEAIDDGGSEYVFNRVNYCPFRCNSDPAGPGCEDCRMGGSGSF